jgi:hypothetical protein
MPMNTSRQITQPQTELVFEYLLLHNDTKGMPVAANPLRSSAELYDFYEMTSTNKVKLVQ